MATKDDVIRIHGKHPDWCAAEIAAALDCPSAYVRATAQRNGLKLPKLKGRIKPRSERILQALDLGRVCLAMDITLADLLDFRAPQERKETRNARAEL